jgi:hypothetical protein
MSFFQVHGGWSSWGKWGTCSATCDTGMRRRIRSCTKPRPERFGNHCFGNNDEAELCKFGPCTSNVCLILSSNNSDKVTNSIKMYLTLHLKNYSALYACLRSNILFKQQSLSNRFDFHLLYATIYAQHKKTNAYTPCDVKYGVNQSKVRKMMLNETYFLSIFFLLAF